MIAVGGLIIYGIYFFALIKLIPVTMTLPGIAGLILTIGVAADANIVIFERVKEEIRGGRSIVSGIATGYKRGFAAIVDANVVTFMTAFILFALATAEVKGFAFTLGHRHARVAVHRGARHPGGAGHDGPLETRSATAGRSAPSATAAAGRSTSWAHSKWFFSLSGTILLIGALAIGGKGLNLGIDFKSGTRIQTALIKPATRGAGRRSDVGARASPTRRCRSSATPASAAPASRSRPRRSSRRPLTKVEQILNERFGTKHFSEKSIGPTFGKTVANSAVIAIIASLLVISAYIALRFEWKYAVPVLIALMHDLLITAGVYSLTGREVTTATVAAPADDPRVFAVRHDHRLRSCARERAANAARRVLAGRQPVDVRGADPIAGDDLLHAAAGDGAAAVRRRNAQGLRLRADDRHRIRRLLVDLHRLAGPDALEGARAGLPRAAAPGSSANSALVPAYATTATGAPEDVEPEQKKRRARRGGARGAGRADLTRRVPGAGARPRRRCRAPGARSPPEPPNRQGPRPPPPRRRRRPPSATPPPTSRRRTWSSRTTRRRGRRAGARATNATGGPDDRHGRAREVQR